VALGYPACRARADQPKRNPEAEAGIQKTAEAFVTAFQKGDAAGVAAFWTPDGDYVDVAGRHLKGREAIEKAFQELFSEHNGLKRALRGLPLGSVPPDAAIEEATSEVFPPDGGPPSRSRYTNLLVKKGDRWYLSSVRESPFAPSG